MICTRVCMYTMNGECGLKLTSSDDTNRCPLMPDDVPENKPYKPLMTNADRIRAMSDEELAEFLCGVYDDGEYEYDKFICGVIIPYYNEDSLKEWLKQPADEERDKDAKD